MNEEPINQPRTNQSSQDLTLPSTFIVFYCATHIQTHIHTDDTPLPLSVYAPACKYKDSTRWVHAPVGGKRTRNKESCLNQCTHIDIIDSVIEWREKWLSHQTTAHNQFETFYPLEALDALVVASRVLHATGVSQSAASKAYKTIWKLKKKSITVLPGAHVWQQHALCGVDQFGMVLRKFYCTALTALTAWADLKRKEVLLQLQIQKGKRTTETTCFEDTYMALSLPQLTTPPRSSILHIWFTCAE